MKPSNLLIFLSVLIALMAAIASAAGLFMNSGPGPFAFTTVHGQEIQLYGRGLYFYDWAFKAPIQRGTDAVILFGSVPLLVFAILYYRRGTLRGRLLLASVLSCFLYFSASLAFGTAYNPLFLLYVVYFSASLFAFVTALAGIDLKTLAASVQPSMPRRGIAIFMVIAGLSVLVWLLDKIGPLVLNMIPEAIASYTTDATAVLDIGIIGPSAYLTAVLLFRRRPLGYLLAPNLLVLNATIGLIVIAQTIAQRLDGIVLSVQVMIVFVGIFVVTSLFAAGLVIRYFRALADGPNQHSD